MLTASDIVRAWEAGGRRHPVDRAVLLLSLLHPDEPVDTLWGLTVGQRNRRLLDMYEQTAGATIACVATCHHCGEVNEFSVPVNDIRYDPPEETRGLWREGDLAVEFRQPSNLDLVPAALETDVAAARRLIARRCITAVKNDGHDEVDTNALSEETIAAIGDAIREQDPQVELHFKVICAVCDQSSSVLFDVVAFVWAEVNRFAQRVLHEVHLLARAYGWSEADILAMTPQRRQFYLDLLGT